MRKVKTDTQYILKTIKVIENVNFEYLALKHGIKPTQRSIIDHRQFKRIKEMYEKNGIYITHSDYKIKRTKTMLRPASLYSHDGQIILYASKLPKLAEALKEQEVKRIKGMYLSGKKFFSVVDETIGHLLGYPQCCINFFKKNTNFPSSKLIISAYENTKHAPSFYLNNLHAYPGSRFGALISHFPCSYDCNESKRYAQKVLNAICGLKAEIREYIEFFLKLPVLLLNNGKTVFFDNVDMYGRSKRYTFVYKSTNQNHAFQKDRNYFCAYNTLKKGNSMIFDKKALTIFHNDKKVGKIKNEKPLLFIFK
ncbi:MAG: DUF483 domain-containing protein [Candidatus Omnitrophota bacterium]